MPAKWKDLTCEEQEEVQRLHSELLQPEFLRTIRLATNSSNLNNDKLINESTRWDRPESMIDGTLLPLELIENLTNSENIPDEIGKDILILVAPNYENNPWAHKLHSGRPLIVLNFGNWFSGYFAAATFFEFIHNELTPDRDKALMAIIATARAIDKNDIFYFDLVWQLIPKPQSDRETIGLLSCATMAFILAHEFGHHVLGHKQTSNKVQSQKQEFEADHFALELCSNLASTETVLHASGLFFHLLHICDVLDDNHEATTHPLPIDRWRALKSSLSSSNDQIVSLIEDVMGDAVAASKNLDPQVRLLHDLLKNP